MVLGNAILKNESLFNDCNKGSLIFPVFAMTPSLSYANPSKYFRVYASIKVLPGPVSDENTSAKLPPAFNNVKLAMPPIFNKILFSVSCAHNK